jgi:hypothetical protein
MSMGLSNMAPVSGSNWANMTGATAVGAKAALNSQCMCQFTDWGGVRISGYTTTTFYTLTMMAVYSVIFGTIRIVGRAVTAGGIPFGCIYAVQASTSGTVAANFSSALVAQPGSTNYLTGINCTPSGNTLPLTLGIAETIPAGNYDYQYFINLEIC